MVETYDEKKVRVEDESTQEIEKWRYKWTKKAVWYVIGGVIVIKCAFAFVQLVGALQFLESEPTQVQAAASHKAVLPSMPTSELFRAQLQVGDDLVLLPEEVLHANYVIFDPHGGCVDGFGVDDRRVAEYCPGAPSIITVRVRTRYLKRSSGPTPVPVDVVVCPPDRPKTVPSQSGYCP